MSHIEDTGNVEEKHEEKEIEWKITNFFSLAENRNEIRCSDFSFAGSLWYLRLFPKSIERPGFMYWCLWPVNGHNCSLVYNFGLKKEDGSVEYLNEGILRENHVHSAFYYIKLIEIQQRKRELAPTNVLIIICTLKRITTDSDQPKILDNPKIEKLISK